MTGALPNRPGIASRLPVELVMGTGALLVLRLALSAARSGPVIMADEAGYLMNARSLAGGMAADMGSSPFYRGGYSLLLAPVLSLADDPVRAYHGVLVVNAFLAAALAPLLYLLLRRSFGASARTSAWAALAGAAYPSVTASSQVALSENLLYPLTVLWLIAASSLLRAESRAQATGRAVAAGACAGALWTVHGRMVVVVGVTAVMLAVALVRRVLPAEACGAGLAALAVVLLAGRALDAWLLDENWGGHGRSEVESTLSSLHDVDSILIVLRNLAGQTWYLLAATLGIALLAAAGAAPGAVRSLRRGLRDARPGDNAAALLLATVLGLLLVSSVWFVETTRADQLIYGRYVEPAVPPLLAVGLAAFGRRARLPRGWILVVLAAALTAVVAASRSTLDVSVSPSRWNVASLPFVTGRIGPAVIVAAGLVATLCGWALLETHRRAPARLAQVALLLFVPTTVYVAYLPVLRSERDAYPAGWTSPQVAVDAHRLGSVGYDLDHFDHVAVKVYQWFLPHTPVLLFHGRGAASPPPAFFSGRRLEGRLATRPATRAWIDAARDQALWVPETR